MLWTVARQTPCPWNFPGKNPEMGCHFLLQGISPSRDQTRVSCIGRCHRSTYVKRFVSRNQLMRLWRLANLKFVMQVSRLAFVSWGRRCCSPEAEFSRYLRKTSVLLLRLFSWLDEALSHYQDNLYLKWSDCRNFSGKESTLQGTQVQSLDWELRSHMLQGSSALMPPLRNLSTTTRESISCMERSSMPQLRPNTVR